MRAFLWLLPLSVISAAFAQEPAPSAPTISAVPPPTPPAEVVPPAPAGSGADLKAALATLPTLPVFAKSTVGIDVVNIATGEQVYAHGDDAPMIPASTMKLITSAVALKELGPAYRFPTWVKYTGELGADGVLAGNLHVVGQGDPTMVVERMWKMVADIKARGVTEVQGDVVFDDSYMAGSTFIPGWNKPEDLADGTTYYSALGALSVNYNMASIVVRPGVAVGGPALASFETPSDVLVLDNQLTTGKAKSKYWVKIERAIDANQVATYKLTGNVPAEQAADTLYRTLANPTGNYVSVFKDLARAAGLKVKGRYRTGPNATDSKLLLKVESERLVEILLDMNKQSNNFMAEQILRAVGAEKAGLPGTTEGGVAVLGKYMTELGVSPDRYKFVNGSGLSRAQVISPTAMDAVLADMYRNVDVGPEFVSTLAVGGRDGTLWARFREDGMEGRVRAKTGSLGGVFCLSGFVRGVDGTDYAFSFFVNDLDGSTARARTAHDQLVRALAGVQGNLAEAGDGGGD